MRVDGKNLNRISAHAEFVSLKRDVIPLVAYVDKLSKKLVPRANLTGAERDDHARIVNRVAKAVYARDGRDDKHVAPLKQARRRRVAKPLDLIVN